MKDFGPTFGLPPSLRVPIAAVDEDAIAGLVGRIKSKIVNRDGRTNAMLVKPFESSRVEGSPIPLWTCSDADSYRARLFPPYQVWVHVDFSDYRAAYISFGMPPIPQNHFLDHIQNREAVRIRGYTHPFLRLCPVARTVNTSGGHSSGGEGMEKDYLESFSERPMEEQRQLSACLSYLVQYADPMDLTKMLNISPGTQTLPGVADVQQLFYPA